MNQIERNARFKSLLAQLEEQRPALKGRSYRVSVYAVAMGQQMGLDANRLVILRLAAMVHGASKLPFDDPDKEIIEEIISDESNPSPSVERRILEAAIALVESNEDDAIADMRKESGKFMPAALEALEKVAPLIQPLQNP